MSLQKQTIFLLNGESYVASQQFLFITRAPWQNIRSKLGHFVKKAERLTRLKAQHMPRSVGIVVKMEAHGITVPFQVQYLSRDLKKHSRRA